MVWRDCNLGLLSHLTSDMAPRKKEPSIETKSNTSQVIVSAWVENPIDMLCSELQEMAWTRGTSANEPSFNRGEKPNQQAQKKYT